MSSYEYIISFHRTTEHANADALSRLPLPSTPLVAEEPPELVLLIDHLEELPVTVKDISTWTEKDPTTAAVPQHIRQGWPNVVNDSLKPFSARRNELSVHTNCILWGT